MLAMHQLKTRFEVALYVWDYFYLSQRPASGDEAAWAVIERATCRIRESEIYLGPSTPSHVRLRSARRVRNAVRTAMRHIKLLSVEPEQWVLDGLVTLESLADEAIAIATAGGPVARD
jgi:hypothetical protein